MIVEVSQRERELMKLVHFFQKFSRRRVTLTLLYYKTEYTYRTVEKEILKLEEKGLVEIDKFKKKKRKKVKTNSWSITLTELGVQTLLSLR